MLLYNGSDLNFISSWGVPHESGTQLNESRMIDSLGVNYIRTPQVLSKHRLLMIECDLHLPLYKFTSTCSFWMDTLSCLTSPLLHFWLSVSLDGLVLFFYLHV